MILNYEYIRRLVRDYLIEASSKERGSVFGFNHKRFSSYLGKRRIHPVDMSVIWSVILNDYKEAIVEIRVKNHRKHVLFDKKKLISILKEREYCLKKGVIELKVIR